MQEELRKIGLSENESKVYLALLELGSATAQQISEKAKVKRPTTYVELEALMKMGVVTTFEKAGKKDGPTKTLFRAEDPEYLKNIIEREKKKSVERERVLGDVLPDLGKLFLASGERPRVRFFEGVEGLESMNSEFLKSKTKQIEAVTSLDEILNLFPHHLDEYSPERVKKGIKSKIIYTYSGGPIFKKNDKQMLRDSRYIPKDKFPFSFDFYVYENRTAISVLRGKPFGIVIESKEIADSMRSVFNLAWEAAEKYQK